MERPPIVDHRGDRLAHSRRRVNGVDLHVAVGGSGPPLYLLHGAPKTMYGWRHLVPLLTPHFTVVLFDCRGFGDSERPLSAYDTRTLGGDVAALATQLGHRRFRLMGEDWGAAVAYATAAFHRDRVEQLVYQEMRLPGLEPSPAQTDLAPDDTRTGWHFDFFAVPGYPELLLPGREREFWGQFMRRQMHDPSMLAPEDLDDVVDWISRPGGLHALLSVYRAKSVDAEQNLAQFGRELAIPVLAIGGEAYLGEEVGIHLRQVGGDVTGTVLPRCGHHPALEVPGALAEAVLGFALARAAPP